ncbi:MAG: hypothetical protein LBD66_00370, partial [Holosporales bacterium]|nr:hypothetical protein [Holosporales bacterium]
MKDICKPLACIAIAAMLGIFGFSKAKAMTTSAATPSPSAQKKEENHFPHVTPEDHRKHAQEHEQTARSHISLAEHRRQKADRAHRGSEEHQRLATFHHGQARVHEGHANRA